MKNEISLSEALSIINRKAKDGSAFPFDVSVRTLNRNSKTGGKLINYKGAKLLINENSKNKTGSKLLDNVLVAETVKRNPNHWENRTRNILLPNGEKRKLRFRLIIDINNQKVVY